MLKSWLLPALLTIALLLLMVVTMAIIGDIQGGLTPESTYILYGFYVLILLTTFWWTITVISNIITSIRRHNKKSAKPTKR